MFLDREMLLKNGPLALIWQAGNGHLGFTLKKRNKIYESVLTADIGKACDEILSYLPGHSDFIGRDGASGGMKKITILLNGLVTIHCCKFQIVQTEVKDMAFKVSRPRQIWCDIDVSGDVTRRVTTMRDPVGIEEQVQFHQFANFGEFNVDDFYLEFDDVAPRCGAALVVPTEPESRIEDAQGEVVDVVGDERRTRRRKRRYEDEFGQDVDILKMLTEQRARLNPMAHTMREAPLLPPVQEEDGFFPGNNPFAGIDESERVDQLLDIIGRDEPPHEPGETGDGLETLDVGGGAPIPLSTLPGESGDGLETLDVGGEAPIPPSSTLPGERTPERAGPSVPPAEPRRKRPTGSEFEQETPQKSSFELQPLDTTAATPRSRKKLKFLDSEIVLDSTVIRQAIQTVPTYEELICQAHDQRPPSLPFNIRAFGSKDRLPKNQMELEFILKSGRPVISSQINIKSFGITIPDKERVVPVQEQDSSSPERPLVNSVPEEELRDPSSLAGGEMPSHSFGGVGVESRGPELAAGSSLEPGISGGDIGEDAHLDVRAILTPQVTPFVAPKGVAPRRKRAGAQQQEHRTDDLLPGSAFEQEITDQPEPFGLGSDLGGGGEEIEPLGFGLDSVSSEKKTFEEYIRPNSKRRSVAHLFVAMLGLQQRKCVKMTQTEAYGEIQIEVLRTTVSSSSDSNNTDD